MSVRNTGDGAGQMRKFAGQVPGGVSEVLRHRRRLANKEGEKRSREAVEEVLKCRDKVMIFRKWDGYARKG